MSIPTPHRRLLAMLVDAALIGIVVLLSSAQSLPDLTGLFAILTPQVSPRISALLAQTAATVLIYYTVFDTVLSTPGKLLMGLRVLSTRYHRPPGAERALKRTLAGALDLALLTAFLLPLLTPSGRTLADRFTSTIVLHRSRTTQAADDNRAHAPVLLSGADVRRLSAGRKAEREVAGHLAPLEERGYTLLRNLSHRAFGDIDLCLVGPGGVYVVEVKSHRGEVSRDPRTGELLRDGCPFERDFDAQVGRQVEFLAGYLFKNKKRPPLYALICMPNATLAPNASGRLPEAVGSTHEVYEQVLCAPPALKPTRANRMVARLRRLEEANQHPYPDGNPHRHGSGHDHRREHRTSHDRRRVL